MRLPLPVFALFVAAYLIVIGCGWFRQIGTEGELAGHAAKIEAILHLLRSGDFAWFPDYLSGAPAASLLSFALAIPVYAPALWISPDPAMAMKATALVLLALGGFSAFAFGRRLSGNGWSAFAVGCAWLLSPQLLLRAGWQEHMTILVAVPLVPLAFLALLRVAERGTVFDAILLAVSFSAALLAWSKMGATLVIPLAVFAGWLFGARPECRLNLLRGAVWAIPTTILLGVVPLLPLVRERAFMTVFELDPFKSWQAMYSVKSATSWFDRGGILSANLPAIFQIDRGGYYLGFVGLAAVAGTVFVTWRHLRPSREIATIRIFLMIALAMFWVSFGPRSVLQGHFELLAGAEAFPDLAIVLHWLALAAQGALIFWFLPRGRWRVHAFVAIFVFYLLAPAFRLLEWLPVYADLRAPDSFWILNGSFAWAVASALAVVFMLNHCFATRWRPLLAGGAFAAACLDFSAYFGWFHGGGLGSKTFADYREAAARLKGKPGRVQEITKYYFPLDLPAIAGRPITTEALNHYLMPRDSARLQAASSLSATNMLAFFRIAGIGNLLLASDSSSTAQKWFRSLLPVEFENDSFAILTNPQPLYPGFFSDAAIPAPGGYEECVAALKQAQSGRITIADPGGKPSASLPGMKASAGSDFLQLDPLQARANSRISFRAPGKPGWVVFSESWHPDWTATVDGAPARVYRAAGGYPGVPVTTKDAVVEFRFEPPRWYSVCLGVGSLTWLIALGFLATARFFPERSWMPVQMPDIEKSRLIRKSIVRPIALVPTYDESGSIDELLERVLATRDDMHLLVIDDGSPDGTATRVRGNPHFGKRVHLLERPSKQGLGSAYREGFRWALQRGYDACIEIDADLSHDPADIPRLLAALDAGADAAIGSRYLGGLRVVNWPHHRLLLSTGASRYVQILTALPLTDATSGFKALRAASLDAIDWKYLRADGYGFQVELHWLLWKAGLQLVEVPIVFTERRAGATKMTAGIAIEAAWRVLQLAVIDRPQRREK